MDSHNWIWLVGALVLVWAVFQVLRGGGKRIDGAQAKALIKEGAKLIDVRTPGEFARGHLPGALNIPHHEIAARLTELGARDRTLVVYCHSGSRSGVAVRMLQRSGFTQVHNLGPMAAW